MPPHDKVVGGILANVLTAGADDPLHPVPEDAVTALERSAFLPLLGKPATLERIRHMLATGKPLRN